MDKKVNVGLIGVGNISGQYIRWLRTFNILNLVAVSDLDVPRARTVAQENNIAKGYSVEELLADSEVDIVINLTIPAAHAKVSLEAIAAGKHVYSEKPLAITREDGQRIIDAAKARGVLVGCAPDTFMGGGLQTCRKLIDDGRIGVPVAATAFMAGHGPESWHPNPDFFYKVGGGPMFDMGPYYLTAMVNLMGPVRRVAGSARITFAERVATSQAKNGHRIDVEIPTHVTSLLDFAGGAIGTLITSFDVWSHQLPRIEIYGSEGSLSVPDPNTFSGPVRLRRSTDDSWQEVPLTHSDNVGRGIGVADMAYAIRYGRPHRASGDLAFHVLDIMHAIHESSDQGRHIELEQSVTQPAPLPLNLSEGELDTTIAILD